MRKMMTVLLLAMFTISANAGKINVEKSTLSWKATKLTGKHWGTIKIKEGNIEEKDGALTGGNFVVDMTSIAIDKDDLQGEYHDKLLSHLESDDFFSTKKHETSMLKIKNVKANGKGKYTVSADLTIKGKTKKVKDFEVTSKNGTYSGTVVFNRTKYGIKYNSGSFFENLGDKLIHDDVTLTFSVK